MELPYQTFDIRSSMHQQLVVDQAVPGSASEQRLSLLGSLAIELVQNLKLGKSEGSSPIS